MTDDTGATAIAERPASSARPQRADRTRARALRRALVLTVGSALVPGLGHLYLRRRAGKVILGGFFLLGAGGLWLLLTHSKTDLLGYAVSPAALTGIGVGAAVAGFVWVLVVLRTYTLARPDGISVGQRALAGVVVMAVCSGIALPTGLVASAAWIQKGLIGGLFAAGGKGGSDLDAMSQWKGKDRVNIVIIGSDAGPDRTGARNDTTIVASIDTHSGEAVLISIPRNLQNVPLPSSLRQYGRGGHGEGDYDLFNATYAIGMENFAQVPGSTKETAGPDLIKIVAGNVLGLKVDYFVDINLQGFADIVDALDGVTLRVDRRYPIGGLDANGKHVRPSGYIQPGLQRMDGDTALAYARSRSDSSDFDRMLRQRCVIGGVMRQVSDPLTVLRKFESLASATQKNVLTDIPLDVLPAFVGLAVKVKQHPIESVTLTDQVINPSRPDYAKIRSLVQQAFNRPPASQTPSARGSFGPSTSAPAVTPSPSPSASRYGQSTSSTGRYGQSSPSASKYRQSAPSTGKSAQPASSSTAPPTVGSLDQVCQYS